MIFYPLWDIVAYIIFISVLFFISVKNALSKDINKNVYGYFIIPFLGGIAIPLLLTLIFLVLNPACNEGMGCGFNLLIYMAYGILTFFLLIINHRLIR